MNTIKMIQMTRSIKKKKDVIKDRRLYIWIRMSMIISLMISKNKRAIKRFFLPKKLLSVETVITLSYSCVSEGEKYFNYLLGIKGWTNKDFKMYGYYYMSW